MVIGIGYMVLCCMGLRIVFRNIVTNGSQAGMVPNWVTFHGPYTSAKAAVHALGAALRPEAAEYGVGVTIVVIAGTQTEIMKSERSRPERFGKPLKNDMERRTARRVPASDVASNMIDQYRFQH